MSKRIKVLFAQTPAIAPGSLSLGEWEELIGKSAQMLTVEYLRGFRSLKQVLNWHGTEDELSTECSDELITALDAPPEISVYAFCAKFRVNASSNPTKNVQEYMVLLGRGRKENPFFLLDVTRHSEPYFIEARERTYYKNVATSASLRQVSLPEILAIEDSGLETRGMHLLRGIHRLQSNTSYGLRKRHEESLQAERKIGRPLLLLDTWSLKYY